MNIIHNVQDIIRSVLNNNDISINRDTVADDVPFWDSVAHVRIMIMIEEHFSIIFDPDELNSFENVGELVDSIAAKS